LAKFTCDRHNDDTDPVNPVSDANRRIHTRRRARVAARLAHEGASVEGVIENIGAGGAFFATEDLEMKVDDGGAVTLTFRCRKAGADAEVACAGAVLRADLNFDGAAVVRTFAIQFADLLPLEGIEFA
jgi:hypothetical protein